MQYHLVSLYHCFVHGFARDLAKILTSFTYIVFSDQPFLFFMQGRNKLSSLMLVLKHGSTSQNSILLLTYIYKNAFIV